MIQINIYDNIFYIFNNDYKKLIIRKNGFFNFLKQKKIISNDLRFQSNLHYF